MYFYVVSHSSNCQLVYSLCKGQFWNVPVSIKPFTGSINEDYGDSVRDRLYLVTVHQGNNSRTFVGEYSKTSWDRSGEPK